jgi:uncharacterized protein YutE (UPF0331/DUF86 family)
MVDRDLTLRKVAAIHDAVMRIRDRTPAAVEVFVGDRDAREIVVLNLFVALPEALDLATHWLADEGRRVPEGYRDVFLALGDAGVLDPGLAIRLGQAAGLRNLVAPRYGALDFARIHAIATTELDDLEAFGSAMARDLP